MTTMATTTAPKLDTTSTSTVISGPVLMFDGVCNLCDNSVQFVLRNERSDQLRFVALQSETGRRLLAEHRLDPAYLDSLVFIEEGMVYTKSTAALRLARYLRAPYRLLYAGIWMPRAIRDSVYAYIASKRYSWFGRKSSCMMPTPELRRRFFV